MSVPASDAPFDLLRQIEARARSARQGVAAGQAQAWVGLGFRLGEQWWVAPREDVREIITVPALTRVPGAKPWLLGLANVRGNLLPVCDLRRLLEPAPPQVAGRNSRVLVYHSQRVPAGFLVDEVAGYRSFVVGEQQSKACAQLAPAIQAWTLGAFSRDAQTWFVLSLHKLVASAAFQQAGAG